MRVIFSLSLLTLFSSGLKTVNGRSLDDTLEHRDYRVFYDLDGEDNLDEDTFEEEFEIPTVDADEKSKRVLALENAEETIKHQNEKYLNEESEWYSKLNDFSDLPEEEFKEEKAGLNNEYLYARGLLTPEDLPVDKDSERFFEEINLSRVNIPSSYSAVEENLVSDVKDQLQCGSCVAFSTMAAIETCFKKQTGVFGDYSEQQLIDCGYGENGAAGCEGAGLSSYLKLIKNTDLELTHENTYPYLNRNPKLTCPTVEPYFQGAKVINSYYTFNGNEEVLKKLVATFGAVMSTVASSGPFQYYGGGIFSGCTSSKQDHAITVVGYGEDNGEDFWLIKNSWGSDWGEAGFIRLRRGEGMCGIGKQYAVPVCRREEGTTSAPVTTSTPCQDKYSNCPRLAETNCRGHGEHCPESCGLCEGMTPHSSNYCYNTFSDCQQIKAWGLCHKYKTECCISCGDHEVTTEEVVTSTTEEEVTSTTEASGVGCSDTSKDCQYISAAGLCSKIPNKHCHKTCGDC